MLESIITLIGNVFAILVMIWVFIVASAVLYMFARIGWMFMNWLIKVVQSLFKKFSNFTNKVDKKADETVEENVDLMEDL